MKESHRIWEAVACFVFLSVFTSACVNHITEEAGEATVSEKNIPFTFTAGIHKATNTRVADNQFETEDVVGLFALAGSTTMKEERYADNLRFVRSSTNEFVADESFYYPDDGVTLQLISYYPYRAEGVAIGESTMPVAVAASQNLPADYSHSDFLIAVKENVIASKTAVPLMYNHKFFRLKITLIPGEGEDVESLLTSNPTLAVNGFYSKAIYDFQKETFSGYSDDEEEITPAGEWEIMDEQLVGKELILIPQEATEGVQYIVLEVGDKPYLVYLPSSLELKSGKQRELEVTFVASEDILMSKVSGEIGDWEGTEKDQTESQTLHKYVDVSKLTFDKSNVYKVLHGKKQVAEICKEYLLTPDFSSEAIVAYPMKADATVDLTQGKVVQLLGQPAGTSVHGGTVSWNQENHSLSYVAGTQSIRNNVYVMKDGSLSLSFTAKDEVLPVLVLSDVVRDVRGGSSPNYPLVKIGTQYWMRSNLKVTLYADGNEIPELKVVTTGAIGYLTSEKGNCYYTAATALSDKLLPAHWSMPNWEDWNILKAYLKDDASLLKAGTWLPSKVGEAVQPATNLSGFNGVPVGMYVGLFQADYEGIHLGYWTLDNSNAAIADKVFYMKSNTNLIEESNAGTDTKAFSIRCIRK